MLTLTWHFRIAHPAQCAPPARTADHPGPIAPALALAPITSDSSVGSAAPSSGGCRSPTGEPRRCVMPNLTVPLGVFDPTFRDRVRDATPLEHVINDDLRAAGHPPLTG